MLKKAIILLSLGMVGAFVFVFFLDQGETKPLVSYHRPSIQNKTHGDTKAAQKMNSENAYAAIVLIPKSYLPALERFKRSNMGKLIQILPAKLEWRDGEMTAVMKNHKGNSGIKIEPKKEVSTASDTPAETRPAEKRNKILGAGLLYLLAGINKAKSLN